MKEGKHMSRKFFADVCPELVKEWSDKNLPLTPEQVTFGSHKVVWWKAACGHEWKAAISSRSLGSKCAYCSGRILKIGMNDFQTTHPELAKEWSKKNKNIEPTMIKAN